MKKDLLFGTLVLVDIVLIVVLRHQEYDLETLCIWLANVVIGREERLITLAVAFVATNFLVTALYLPVAVWMTLAGGAFSGSWVSLLIVSLHFTDGATFYLVSQAGMLPGMAVFVNVGTLLAQLESHSGVTSHSLLVSFALLGFSPWIAHMFLNFLKNRKTKACSKKASSFVFSLVESNKYAVGEWRKAHMTATALGWVNPFHVWRRG